MTTEERIKKDAEEQVKSILMDGKASYPSWEEMIVAGAKTERNKVIDEVIQELRTGRGVNITWKSYFYKYLESLKIKGDDNQRA